MGLSSGVVLHSSPNAAVVALLVVLHSFEQFFSASASFGQPSLHCVCCDSIGFIGNTGGHTYRGQYAIGLFCLYSYSRSL